MELQVEACMKEEDEVAAATITQAPSAVAGRGLHVMALLQGTKKLFGPLLK